MLLIPQVWDAIGPGDCKHNGSCSQPDYWNSYSTHLFTDRAIKIIGDHAKEAAAGTIGGGSDAEAAPLPLFLYLAYQGASSHALGARACTRGASCCLPPCQLDKTTPTLTVLI